MSKIVEVLMINKCNLNTPNDQMETPFYSLLEKLKTMPVLIDLIIFALYNQEIDFFYNKSDEITRTVENE